MAGKTSEVTAEGKIEHMFPITGRGYVVALKLDFRGKIHENGIVESDLGSAPYNGVNFLDSISTPEETCICVIVADEFKELFAPGQTVRFYRQSSEDAGRADQGQTG